MNETLKTALKLALLLIAGSALGFGPTVSSVTQNAQKVRTALAADEYQAGANHLLILAKSNPWWTSLWEKAGKAAFLAGDYSLANEAYLGAYQLGDLSVEGQVDLGMTYLSLDDREGAENTWLELSDSPSAMKNLADLYEEEGDISKAIEFWSQYLALLETNPDSGELYYFGLLIAADSPPKSLVYLDQVSAEYPAAGHIAGKIRDTLQEEPAYQLISAGQALAAADQWRLASFAFEKAVSLRPDYPEAYFYWGESLQQIEDPPADPQEILQQGLELDEDSPLGNLFMGIYWQRSGSHATALDFFAVVETLWPDRADVLVEEAKSLAALGDLETALLKYQTAIELYPQDPDYYRMLAEFCVRYAFQVRESALPAARLAVQFDPDNPANLDVQGQVLLALGDEINAIRFYLQALAIDPTYAPASYHLGILYSVREEVDLAVYYLNQALANSTNPALTDQAQRLLSTY